MESHNYIVALDLYRNERLRQLTELGKAAPPIFKSIDCDLANMELSTWLFTLSENHVSQAACVLYYFELKEVGNELKSSIVSAIESKKGPKKGDLNFIALPKVNPVEKSSNTILYVGKTEKNFPYRIQLHMGLRTPNTYALHLKRWSTMLFSRITLHYAVFKEEDKVYLEEMESALHYYLKPILGREGH